MSYPTPDPVPGNDWPPTRPAPDPKTLPLAADANIQGNVLAAFNKDHQVLLFITWTDATAARAWLGEVRPRLSRNDEVVAFNARFSAARRAAGRDPEDIFAVWTNVSFTAAGIESLAPDALDELKRHEPLDEGVQLWLDGSSNAAVAASIGDVGPSDPSGWLFGAAEPPIRAIVCVAADRPSDLETEMDRHRELAAKHDVHIIFEQVGRTQPGPAAGHEHFGFKDGISQPGVLGLDPASTVKGHEDEVAGKLGTDLIAAGTFVLGYPRDIVDPVRVPLWMFDGSFLTTRRLAQDVPGFWAGVEVAHAKLTGTAITDPITGIPSADVLAAKLVGRWRSGTPTADTGAFDNRSAHDPARDNDFDFKNDPDGDHTPICAHIRKVYPRKGAEHLPDPQTLTEAETKARRILRRGIPFGLPFQPTAGRGHGVDSRRGLVFQCYQASLADQFVFLQEKWINREEFPVAGTGNDAVIGLASTVSIRAGGEHQALSFADFVRTEGSVFAFTPSLPTVARLAAGEALRFS
jgi:Dyp-type peroxidase family